MLLLEYTGHVTITRFARWSVRLSIRLYLPCGLLTRKEKKHVEKNRNWFEHFIGHKKLAFLL